MKKELIFVRKPNSSQEAAKNLDNKKAKISKENNYLPTTEAENNQKSKAKNLTDSLISFYHSREHHQNHLHYILTSSHFFEGRRESLELNTFEMGRLFEVQYNLSTKFFPDENSLTVVPTQPYMDIDFVLGLSALYLRKVVAFCKRMTPFTALAQVDQLLLLKAYVPSTLLVRASFLYQPQRVGWNWLVVS